MPTTINGRPTYASDYIPGDWDKSVFLGNPHIDNIMTTLVNLGGEYWVMRRRLMVVEKLLALKCGLTTDEIDEFQPSDEETQIWGQSRDDFIRRVFSGLTRETAEISGPIDQTGPTSRPPRTVEDVL